MESNKPAQNIQDSFLNTARKERLSITIYLLSGVKLTGRIRSFDKYSVVLEANGQEQLIFKHAISTVVMGRASTHVPMWRIRRKQWLLQVRPAPVAAAVLRALKDKAFSVGKFISRNPATRARGGTCAHVRKPRSSRGPERERAFLVGMDVRTRGRGGKAGSRRRRSRPRCGWRSAGEAGGAAKSTASRSIPEFDAEESLAELRTLAGSAGAQVVGEILQRRDRPDPATLIGAGKLEEIAGAAASVMLTSFSSITI